MNYGFVCTNYNNAHFTVVAVDSLIAGNRPPCRIVVVDNASAPEDVAILVKLAARVATVDLVLNKENIGYFPGLNVGVRRLRAMEPSLDYAVAGNNDLKFPAEFGRVLATKELEFQRYPVILPDIVTLDGVHQNPHIVGGISALREFVYDAYYANFYLASLITRLTRLVGWLARRKDASQHAEARNVRGGIGACYVLTKMFLDEFGELAAPTFLMGEEYFLTRQLEERGLAMRYEPALVIEHRCNGALEKLSSRKIWRFAKIAHEVRRSYPDRGRLRASPR